MKEDEIKGNDVILFIFLSHFFASFREVKNFFSFSHQFFVLLISPSLSLF